MPRELFDKPPYLPTKPLSLSLTHKIILKLWIFYECQNINLHQHTRFFTWTVTLLEESIRGKTPKLRNKTVLTFRPPVLTNVCLVVGDGWDTDRSGVKQKYGNSLQELWLEIWDGRLGVDVNIPLICMLQNCVRTMWKGRMWFEAGSNGEILSRQQRNFGSFPIRTHCQLFEKVLDPFADLSQQHANTTVFVPPDKKKYKSQVFQKSDISKPCFTAPDIRQVLACLISWGKHAT